MVREFSKRLLCAFPLVACVACGGTSRDAGDTAEGALSSDRSAEFPAASLLPSQPVSYLQYTHFASWAGRGGYGAKAHVDVAVQNLAFEKQVSVHWTRDNWGAATQDCALSYEGSLGNNLELWGSDCRIDGGSNTDSAWLAVQATMNGTTYWDNNHGQNYAIGVGGYHTLLGMYTSPNLAIRDQGYVEDEQTTSQVASGTALVWPYDGNKSVSVIWSIDNWATTNTTAASEQSDGAFTWSVPVNAPSGTKFTWALAYAVDGVTFWDNNDGQNFTATVK